MVKKTENIALEETRSVLHDLEIQKKSIRKETQETVSICCPCHQRRAASKN